MSFLLVTIVYSRFSIYFFFRNAVSWMFLVPRQTAQTVTAPAPVPPQRTSLSLVQPTRDFSSGVGWILDWFAPQGPHHPWSQSFERRPYICFFFWGGVVGNCWGTHWGTLRLPCFWLCFTWLMVIYLFFWYVDNGGKLNAWEDVLSARLPRIGVKSGLFLQACLIHCICIVNRFYNLY